MHTDVQQKKAGKMWLKVIRPIQSYDVCTYSSENRIHIIRVQLSEVLKCL